MATTIVASPLPDTKSFRMNSLPALVYSPAFWLALTVAIGIAWRTVRYLLQFPIWGDESFVCVNFLDNTFIGITGPLRVGQICPLTFLWSELALYHWLGPSELVLRLLPYLAGVAAVALFWPLCRRLLPPLPAALAMALLAVSYYPVRHAVEVKPYSEDLLVALGLLLPGTLFMLDPSRTRSLAFLALFVPLAMVSSYPAVLVAGSMSLVLAPTVWRQPGRSAKVWFVLYNLFLGAAFLGNYVLIGKPQLTPNLADPNNAFNSTWREWFPDYDVGSLLWWFLKCHTGNMMAYPIGGPYFASSLTTLLCLAGIWSFWRGGQRQVLALLLCPFLLSMIAAVLHKYPYGGSARLDQHLAPAICILMAGGIGWTIAKIWPTLAGTRQATVAVLIFLAAFGLAGMTRDLVKPFKTTAELWNRNFVVDLMNRLGPGDQVVLLHGPRGVRPGLEWYFRQHDDCVHWNGVVADSQDANRKIWVVRISVNKPSRLPLPDDLISRRDMVETDYYQSIAPPEHGDDPELAEVFCLSPKGF